MQTPIKLIGRFSFFLYLVLLPSTSQAYIGPGLGLGTIGVVLGVLASSVLILIAIVWIPLKRLLKWPRRTKNSNIKNSDEDDL